MIFRAESAAASAPDNFPAYRLDSHLVLNALNQLAMEAYKLTSREVPLVGLLADYVIAEHVAGVGLNGRLAGAHSLASEWAVCKPFLLLNAFVAGAALAFVENGDLERVNLPNHGLIQMARCIFAAWPDIDGRVLQITLDARDGCVGLAGAVQHNGACTPRGPFAARALHQRDPSPAAAAGVHWICDDGERWALTYAPPPA